MVRKISYMFLIIALLLILLAYVFVKEDRLKGQNNSLSKEIKQLTLQNQILEDKNKELKKKINKLSTKYEKIQSIKKNTNSSIPDDKFQVPIAHVQNQDGIKADFIDATITKDGSLDMNPPKLSNMGYTIKISLPVVKNKKNKNPDTNKPIGSSSEISNAKKQIEVAKHTVSSLQQKLKDSKYGVTDKYLDPRDYNKRVKAQLLSLSAIADATGNLYFLQGEWNKAEKEWLSVLYTTHKISDKLCNLYKSEHRYSDASDIIHLGNFAVDCNMNFMKDRTFKNRVKKYKDLNTYASEP